MNNVRTVSDTKHQFYSLHNRPIHSVYRRFVEELLVELHLLAVNVDFHYDPVLALGVVTSFDQFMAGYYPDQDRESIFQALVQAVGFDPQQLRRDAQVFTAALEGWTEADLMALPQVLGPGAEVLRGTLGQIATYPRYKCGRLFAIGLYTLIEQVAPEIARDESRREVVFTQMLTGLPIAVDRLQKDLDLYHSNLEKMAQAQAVMKDLVLAERRKREQAKTEPPGFNTKFSGLGR